VTDSLPAPRRWTIGLSALGAANMSLGALRQFGLVRRLPDVPFKGFDSDAVMTSAPAFVFGFPDTPLAAAGLAANIPLAMLGGRDRARTMPWLPVSIAAKCVVEVSVAAWFLWEMRYRVHRWCAYCLLGATISTALAALAIDEARHALPSRRSRAVAFGAALCVAATTIAVLHLLDDRRQRAACSGR